MDQRLTSLARLARKPAVFHFGKYKGKRIITVYGSDPKYIGWCLDSGVAGVAESLTGPQRRQAEFVFHEHDENDDRGDWEDDLLNDVYADLMWGKD